MRKWLVPYVGGLTAIVAVQSAAILFMPGWLGPQVRPYIVQLVIFLAILLIPMAAASFAVFRLPEAGAREGIVRVGVRGGVAVGGAHAARAQAGAANPRRRHSVPLRLEPP